MVSIRNMEANECLSETYFKDVVIPLALPHASHTHLHTHTACTLMRTQHTLF